MSVRFIPFHQIGLLASYNKPAKTVIETDPTFVNPSMVTFVEKSIKAKNATCIYFMSGVECGEDYIIVKGTPKEVVERLQLGSLGSAA